MSDSTRESRPTVFTATLTRRGFGGPAARSMVALGLGADADVRKHQKRRKRRGRQGPSPQEPRLAFRFVTAWGTKGIDFGQFDLPLGIAVDAAGNVFVSNTDENQIKKFALV